LDERLLVLSRQFGVTDLGLFALRVSLCHSFWALGTDDGDEFEGEEP